MKYAKFGPDKNFDLKALLCPPDMELGHLGHLSRPGHHFDYPSFSDF